MSNKIKCLVTGATGFIGSHLADSLLAKGYEVRCTVRKTSNLRWLKDKPVVLVEASLSNKDSLAEAVKDVDYIYHVAGLTAAKNYDDFLKGNRDGTVNLLNAAVDNSPNLKRFLHVSSQTASGPSPSKDSPVDEYSPCHPITSYGRSKRAAEIEVEKFFDKLPITIVRPPAVYGPRDTATFDIFKAMKTGIASYIGFGKKYVSIVHSDDLVRGIILAAESEKSIREKYFIASEKFYSWAEINPIIANAMGKKKVLHLHLPHFLVLTVAAVSGFFGKFSAKPPVFNYEKGIDFIQEAWTCSVDKAVKELGYSQEVSLEEGMNQTAKWYKDNGWL